MDFASIWVILKLMTRVILKLMTRVISDSRHRLMTLDSDSLPENICNKSGIMTPVISKRQLYSIDGDGSLSRTCRCSGKWRLATRTASIRSRMRVCGEYSLDSLFVVVVGGSYSVDNWFRVVLKYIFF